MIDTAEQQATNTQAIAELTDNVTRVLGRSAIFIICVIISDNILKKTE